MSSPTGDQVVPLPVLPELLERLSNAATPELLAQAIADAACYLPETTAVVLTPDGPGGVIRVVGVAGHRVPRRRDNPPGKRLSLSGWVFQTGEILHCPDLAADPRAELARHYGFACGSMLSLPAKVSGRVRLVITLYSGRTGGYLLQAMPVLRTLADAAALILELFDLRRAAHRDERHLLALHELSRLPAMSLDPDTVFSISVDLATGLFDLDLCCILRSEREGLRIKAARGVLPDGVAATPDTGVPDLTPFTQTGLVIEALPIHGQAERLGYLVVGRRSTSLSDADRRLLATWTNVAGVMLDNVRLHADASNAHQDAVSLLLAVLESTAPGSRGPARFRSELAASLARYLKLPESEVRNIETAALLADVGLLTGGEAHQAERGADLLDQSEHLQPTAPLIRHRGAWWDGSAPSGGLSREHIPMGARVLAVADAFVRLRTGAANQPPANDAAALIHVKENAGKHYDPAVVAALEAVVWSRLRLAPHTESAAKSATDAAEAAIPWEAELSLLTPREREILHWVAQGCSNREIAAALFLSEATVKTHVSRILQKLDLPDRTKAAVYLMRGLRPPSNS